MILVDSNIVIYAARPEHEALRRRLGDEKIAVSVITRIEVLGYHRLDPEERDLLGTLFDAFVTLPVSDAVADRAIELRQRRRISLGDSVIAATALVEGLTLLTHNTGDYTWIEGLEVEDPLSSP